MYKLHEKMKIGRLEDGKYHVFNGRDKAHYRIGEIEYRFLCSLKTGGTFSELLLESQMSASELGEYLEQVQDMNFLQQKNFVKRKITKIPLFSLDTSAWRSSRLTRVYEQTIFWLFALMLLIAVGLFVGNGSNTLSLLLPSADLENQLFSNLLLFLLLTLFSYLIHELAHALTAINAGLMVPEIGSMLYFFSPVGYADVTGLRFLSSKTTQFKILIAGIVTNLNMALICFLILYFSGPNPFFQNLMYSNVFIVIFNLCFFLKLDGYYLLEISLNEPGLREKSLFYLQRKMGLHKKNIPSIPLIDKLVYVVVGTVSMFYIPLLLANLVLRSITFFWG